MANDNLIKLRKLIDQNDTKLVAILARRFEITKRVGEYKQKNNLKPYDKKREQEMFKGRADLAKKLKLNPEMIIKIFKAITKESRANHAKIHKSIKEGKK